MATPHDTNRWDLARIKRSVSYRSTRLVERILPEPMLRPLLRKALRWRGAAPIPEGDGRWDGAFDPPRLLGCDTLVISGWVLPPHRTVATIVIEVEGRVYGNARIGLPRPEIVRAFGANALGCGFRLDVDLSPFAPGAEVAVTGRITDVGGAIARFPGLRPTCPPRPPPVAPQRPRRSRPVPVGARTVAFTHDLGRGGAQLYLNDVVAGLRERGIIGATAVISLADGPLRAELEQRGVSVFVLHDYRVGDARAWDSVLEDAISLARAFAPDFVFVNTMGAFQGVEVARALGVPSLWAVHESLPPPIFWGIGFSEVANAAVRDRGQAALQEADAFVFAAEATLALYRDHVRMERAHVLPYGLDLTRWTPPRDAADRGDARRRLLLEDDEVVLLCAGTVEARKGQVPLLQAFAGLGGRARLIILGDRGGAYSDTLHAYVSAGGLSHRVRVEPLSNDVRPWILAADALVLASDNESLPFVLMEAMACGTCVVAARVFGVAELIEDGRTGFMFEPNDIVALRHALARVLALSGAARSSVGAAASRHVHEHYGRDRYLDDLAALIRSL